jgi:outer membrane protein TolC
LQLKQFIFYFIVCVLGAHLSANPLSLDVFVTKTLNTHPYVDQAYTEYFKKVKDQAGASAINDWNLFSNYTRTQGGLLFGTYSSESVFSSLDVGTRKVFPEYGTRLHISTGRSQSLSQPSLGALSIPDSYTYEMKVSITQPLFKNAFGVMDQYPLIMQSHLDKMAKLLYQQQLSEFIGDLVTLYIEWKGAHDDLEIIKDQLEKNKKQVAIIQAQLKRGVAEPLDLVLAKQTVTSRELAVLNQERVFHTLTKKIQAACFIKETDASLVIVPEEVRVNLPLKTIGDMHDYLREKSLLRRLFQINADMSESTLAYRTGALKPQFDVFVSKSFSSTQEKASDAVKNIGENAPLNMGFSFSFPLENTQAKTKKESAEYDLQSIKHSQEVSFLRTEEMIETAVIELNNLDLQLKKMKILLQLAKETQLLEQKKYDQGRSNSFQMVLIAQERVLSTVLQIQSTERAKLRIKNQLKIILDDYMGYFAGVENE